MEDQVVLLAGTANAPLARAVARALGLGPGACTIARFPDTEVSVRIEQSVRDHEVYILQPTSPPVDQNLMELLALADAARRASAARITAVTPYFGYARSDRRHGREPITARLVGDFMEAAGVQHLVAVNLHTPQVEGFFRIPVDTLSAVPVLAAALRDRLDEDCVVVSPDAGRVKMASEYAHLLGCPLAVMSKRRQSGTETETTHLVGEVDGRTCLLIDDMISTGGTIVTSAAALRDAGAREVIVAATHGLFTEGALSRLEQAGVAEVFTTDTVELSGTSWDRLHVVSVAPLLAVAIRRFTADGSLTDLRE